MTPSSKKPPKLLTETELELMTILWRVGEGSVNDVLSELPDGRDLAYTSVSTILRILEQKKAVSSRKEGRGHVYAPLIEKSAYEETSLGHLVSSVFDGAASSLVRRLVESRDLDPKELEAIQAILNERRK